MVFMLAFRVVRQNAAKKRVDFGAVELRIDSREGILRKLPDSPSCEFYSLPRRITGLPRPRPVEPPGSSAYCKLPMEKQEPCGTWWAVL